MTEPSIVWLHQGAFNSPPEPIGLGHLADHRSIQERPGLGPPQEASGPSPAPCFPCRLHTLPRGSSRLGGGPPGRSIYRAEPLRRRRLAGLVRGCVLTFVLDCVRLVVVRCALSGTMSRSSAIPRNATLRRMLCPCPSAPLHSSSPWRERGRRACADKLATSVEGNDGEAGV